MTIAAALCLCVVVGVLGARTAGAAAPTKGSVTVTVAVSPPTEVYGVLDQVFSVTVAPPSTGDVSPTGVITVSDLQVNLCPPITLPAAGVGAVTVICADSIVAIPVNATTIAAYSYSGDQNYLATKGKISGAVTAADTTTSVTASSATGTWGGEQSLVFSATVDDAQAGSVGVPTGTVSVEQGSAVICTVTLANGSGTCSPSATALAPGADPITASYGGDSNFNPSPLSSPVSLTITPASLSVTGTDATMSYGASLPTLASTMAGFVNGGSLATSDVTGQPVCASTATSTSPVGAYPITCTAGSLTSSDYAFAFVPGTLTVSQATTSLSLKPPAATATSPAAIAASPTTTATTLVATVTSEFSGAPTGSVTFLVGGGNYSCTLTANTANSASCSPAASPNISAGTYSVRASYSGDANFLASSSSGALSVAGSGATGGTGTGTGAGTGTGSGSQGGAGGASSGPGAATNSQNVVTLASIVSSEQTLKLDASVSQQTLADQQSQAFYRKLAAGYSQWGGAANSSGTGSPQGSETSGASSASPQATKSTEGFNQDPSLGDSGAAAGGSSGNRVTTSLVVDKSGSLLPVLILALVLALGITAVEIRRRTRRAAVASNGGNDVRSTTGGN